MKKLFQLFFFFILGVQGFSLLKGMDEGKQERTNFVSELFSEIAAKNNETVIGLFKKKLDSKISKCEQIQFSESENEESAFFGYSIDYNNLNKLIDKCKNLFPDDIFECFFDSGDLQLSLDSIGPVVGCVFQTDKLIPYVNFFDSCCRYIENGKEQNLLNIYIDAKMLNRYGSLLNSEKKIYESDFINSFFENKKIAFTQDTYQNFSVIIDQRFVEYKNSLNQWIDNVNSKLENKKEIIDNYNNLWNNDILKTIENKINLFPGGRVSWQNDMDFFDSLGEICKELGDLILSASIKVPDKITTISSFFGLSKKLEEIEIYFSKYIYYKVTSEGYPYAGDEPCETLYKMIYIVNKNDLSFDGKTKEHLLEKLEELRKGLKDIINPLIKQYPGLNFKVLLYKMIFLTSQTIYQNKEKLEKELIEEIKQKDKELIKEVEVEGKGKRKDIERENKKAIANQRKATLITFGLIGLGLLPIFAGLRYLGYKYSNNPISKALSVMDSKKATTKDKTIQILTIFSLFGAYVGVEKLYSLLRGAILRRLNQ